MQTELIQRQYDEVIAQHYDRDPQSVTGDSLDRAIAQIQRQAVGVDGVPLKVFDIGVGTGLFLERLKQQVSGVIQPFGLDLSARMVELAQARLPELTAAVDDAANLDAHFGGESFDLIATHFITGFVPMKVLAPKIHRRLADGGYWSLVGGTKAGFPALQRKATSKVLKWLFGGKSVAVDDVVYNPAGRDEVVRTLEANGFVVRECETFTPGLDFANFNEFMEFAYWGGWLTPFIEGLGLHQAPGVVRVLLNTLVFPMKDHHNIEIVLAQKA
jgi:SAM-dependent methyltransferase